MVPTSAILFLWSFDRFPNIWYILQASSYPKQTEEISFLTVIFRPFFHFYKYGQTTSSS